MDFITALPRTKKSNTGILTVVDKFTKMAHFFPVQDSINSPEVARFFLNGVIKLHGVPSKIITDRDSCFVGHFWTALMKNLKVTQALSTSFHPQTDRQSEKGELDN